MCIQYDVQSDLHMLLLPHLSALRSQFDLDLGRSPLYTEFPSVEVFNLDGQKNTEFTGPLHLMVYGTTKNHLSKFQIAVACATVRGLRTTKNQWSGTMKLQWS